MLTESLMSKRSQVASQKLTDDEKLNIYEKLAEALAKKDIRTILLRFKKFK